MGEYLTRTSSENPGKNPEVLLWTVGVVGMLTGVVTLLGWFADIPRLTDWAGTGISMFPNTAVAALASGASLIFLVTEHRRVSASLGLFVGLIGAATLFEHLSKIDLGIDTILQIREWGQFAAASPGRMGPPAALSFTIVGVSLATTSLEVKSPSLGGQRVAALGGLLTIGIAALSLIGYMFGVSSLYSLPRLTGIAAQTSSVLLTLGLGLLASAPDAEPMKTLRGASADALLVRRVLPFIIATPIIVGGLRTWGESAGLYDSVFGTALRTVIEISLASGLLWWAAGAVGKHSRALHQSEAGLRRQTRQLEAFLETAAVWMHRVGPDGIILWANDAEMKALGYSPSEYIGHHISEFHVDKEVIADILARLHCGERLSGCQARMRCRDGSIKSVLVDSSVLWEDSRFIHTQCFTRDITTQKLAEGAIREGERRFHEMIDALPAAIYTTDAEGRLTYYNGAAVEFSGREPELGTDHWCVSWKLYYPDGTPMPHDACPMAVALKEGRILRGAEAIAERPDGTRVWFQPFPTPLRDANGAIVGGINMLVDITQRKLGEIASSRLAAIIESSDDAIIGKGLDGVITSWNQGAEKIFGYTSSEAVGRHISFIIPPERYPEEDEVISRIRRGERMDHFETERQTKDGRRVNISLTVSPIKDASGRVIGASKVARDITERKQTEALLAAYRTQLETEIQERSKDLIAAHERLRLADRMAAVGTLAAGLAHDMKNVLLPLGMRLDSLMATPRLSHEATAELAVVCALLDHLRAMAKNLSLFAQDPEKEGVEGKTDIGPWRDQVRGFIDASAGSGVVIKWDLPDTLPTIRIAPHRLTQAVLNLVHNARDAISAAPLGGIPTTGRITVAARLQTRPQGPFVLLTVKDDGCGMSEEVMRRCREPFFTTKDRPAAAGASGGTGLGLSLAHAIVERVGGEMDIESVRGKGTTITLLLPVAPAAPRAAATGPRKAGISIEDKRTRAIVTQVLSTLRYEIQDHPEALSDATLLVVEAHTLATEYAADFIRPGSGRRIIALVDGNGALNGQEELWRAAGVELCPRNMPLGALRELLAGDAQSAASQ